ncbi:hypothetical protein KSS87_003999 [Heliosperma pusillum]|nr:hypothetical protein KSS87_003999 [Heliosperma pusillum]
MEMIVRDELEQLLDDDDDMAEMYLTEKLAEQNLDGSSLSSVDEHDDENEDVQPEMDDRMQAERPSEIHEGSGRYESDAANLHDRNYGVAATLARSGTRTSMSHSAISKHLDVEELEMLLEAYFVQIDGTLNLLTTLREYVDDTEDYINIMLDDKQNQLLQMGVMLTTATLVVSAFVVVAGAFGMNIHIELFDDDKAGDPEFLWTVGGGAMGAVVLYILAIAWCKHKGLL